MKRSASNSEPQTSGIKVKSEVDEKTPSKNLVWALVPDNTVITSVPARCSLLEGKEYPVTVGEVRRRMASPERLNVNDLLKILKESKVPENTQTLRERLEQQGLFNQSTARGENFILTGFLSLSEGEAKEMAHDFARLTDDQFPVEAFARQMITYPGITIETAEAAIEHLNFIIQMIETDGRFDGVLFPGAEKYRLETQRGMTRLTNASHGFSKIAFLSFYRKLREVAVEVRRLLLANLVRNLTQLRVCPIIDLRANTLFARFAGTIFPFPAFGIRTNPLAQLALCYSQSLANIANKQEKAKKK